MVRATPHLLLREQIVPRPRDEVFAFFESPANLARITPPAMGFRMTTTGPVEMREGAVFDYRIRVAGFPLRWRSRIEEYRPGERFVDVQVSGPYASWRHEHDFDDAPGGTLVRDRVAYTLPFGPLGELVRRLAVERQLDRIFDYRRSVIAELFNSPTGGSQRAARMEVSP